VFPLAFGCWRLVGDDAPSARKRVEAALDLGLDLFDLADVYGLDHGGRAFGESEALFGTALASAPGLRDRVVLATKGGIVPGVPYDASRAHLVAACEASLARLRTDRIDLYQIHRPDWLAHPAETAAALVAQRDAGKIRAVGVSNYGAAQVEALQRFLPFPIATHQPEFSCWHPAPLRDGVLDQCLARGITPLAWSPLAGGRLAKPREAVAAGAEDARLGVLLDALDAIATREGVAREAVAIAWLLAHPAGVVPIVGTQRPERLAALLRAFDVSLSRADWYAIVAASQGAPLP
jgi:aryl-alcohol dehydrogenase-like predicted oxidoreductase